LLVFCTKLVVSSASDFEYLVTDTAAVRQTLSGKRHTQSRDAILGDHDDIAVVAQFAEGALPLEFLYDCSGVLVAEWVKSASFAAPSPAK
jgi:hypothetical protein